METDVRGGRTLGKCRVIFYNKGIIDEEAKSISDLKAKVFEAERVKNSLTEQEEKMIEIKKTIDLLEETVGHESGNLQQQNS
jgi:hypothetical protein